MEEAQRIYGLQDNLILSGTPQAALKDADALVICTEWRQFRAPDFAQVKALLNEAVIFDGRNMYDPEQMKKKGIVYYAIGR